MLVTRATRAALAGRGAGSQAQGGGLESLTGRSFERPRHGEDRLLRPSKYALIGMTLL
jgi:hypothetical protein